MALIGGRNAGVWFRWLNRNVQYHFDLAVACRTDISELGQNVDVIVRKESSPSRFTLIALLNKFVTTSG